VTIGPLQNSSILTEKRLCSPIKELHSFALTLFVTWYLGPPILELKSPIVLCTLILESVIPTWLVKNYEQSVSWDKAHRTHKTVDDSYAVSQNLWTLEFPQVNDTDAIEIYYSKIIDAIKKAENETLPKWLSNTSA
jgi:hypothetical protein